MKDQSKPAKKIACVFGTRPEAIKMGPVIRELYRVREERGDIEVIVCVTAQHREMLDQVLRLFEIAPDFDLNIMRPNQDLFGLTSNLLEAMGKTLKSMAPDLVLVHGDTTTTMAASLSAFYLGIKVGHVEAGLRTKDKSQPFPEEINRRIAGVLADFHFCPTEGARQNLLNEGVKDSDIVVTGNTVIDALQYTLTRLRSNAEKMKELERRFGYLKSVSGKGKLVLVTAHRRESFGDGFINMCNALKKIVSEDESVEVLYPVHLNPNVRGPVHELLGNTKRIWLIDPLEYEPFVYLMSKSYLVLTDSGGIQEEAPSLGKPVLVLREVTERPEALEAGTVKLVGTDPFMICKETLSLVRNESEYMRMSKAHNPFGDGKAGKRIVDFLMARM